MFEDTEGERDGPSAEINIEAMEKAENILSKYKNTNHLTANPTSTKSWLIHTISTIIQTPGKQMKEQKVKFKNTRNKKSGRMEREAPKTMSTQPYHTPTKGERHDDRIRIRI